MQNVRRVFWGIIIVLITIALTVGAVLLSLTEGKLHVPAFTSTLSPTPTQFATITSIRLTFTPRVNTPTPLPLSPTPSLTLFPTPTATLPPPPTNCPPPRGWQRYMIQPGDTLGRLALLFKRTITEISQANCLVTNDVIPGLIIYLPPLPTHTPTPCGPPSGWVVYIVQQGDTLYRLGQNYGVTVAELQKANCIVNSLIHIGQFLYLPPWSPLFPSSTYPPYNTFDQTLDISTPIPSDTAVPTW
jgi:LysM repeat protein